MSLSLAVSSALANLRGNQAQASIISRNIENAAVPGYVRQDLQLSTRVVAGVNLGLDVSVRRNVDERLIRDVRSAQSETGSLSAQKDLLTRYTDSIGQPQDERSIASQLTKLKTAFQSLVDRPGDPAFQRGVVDAATKTAASLKTMYGAAQQARTDADQDIQTKVAGINQSLQRIADLNRSIRGMDPNGGDVGALQDERDRLADGLSQDLGVSTYLRDGDMVVMTKGGTTLVDSSANLLTAAPFGKLMTADGVDLTPGAGNPNGLQDGALSGLLKIRDETMPQFQAQLDQLAGGLVTLFQARDATVGAPPNDTGLFTDGGKAFDPAHAAGLAGRIAVNDLVRPEAGGALWRVSGGMHAAEAPASGDSRQAQAFLDGFGDQRSFDSGVGLAGSATIQGYATGLVTAQQGVRTSVSSTLDARTVTLESLKSARLGRDGVNIDDELQKMSLVQKSYAASASVLSSVSQMMDTLLKI
jgi:flagellar hook-associated protein 1 FlgK